MFFNINKALSLFFRLLYHPFAWTYDFVSWVVSFGRWQSWVNNCLPYVQGPNILELGYGPGHLQKSLIDEGFAPIGLDESKQMGHIAHRLLKKNAVVKTGSKSYDCHLVNGRTEHLPFISAHFHTVVTTFPTQYIFDSVTLGEVKRVLKPGGKLVVLIAAWIVGDNLIDKGLAYLFKVTGEAPDIDSEFNHFLLPFSSAGFSTEIKWVKTRSSKLLLICASKS